MRDNKRIKATCKSFVFAGFCLFLFLSFSLTTKASSNPDHIYIDGVEVTSVVVNGVEVASLHEHTGQNGSCYTYVAAHSGYCGGGSWSQVGTCNNGDHQHGGRKVQGSSGWYYENWSAWPIWRCGICGWSNCSGGQPGGHNSTIPAHYEFTCTLPTDRLVWKM